MKLIENGETWKEALIRECYEETGYSINIIHSLCFSTIFMALVNPPTKPTIYE